MEDITNLIDDEEKYEFLPGRALLSLQIPMICSKCSEIHFIPVTASAIPKEGGVSALIHEVQARLIEVGYSIPTDAEFKLFTTKARAELEAQKEMEDAQAAAKDRGAVYVPHTPRAGGDA